MSRDEQSDSLFPVPDGEFHLEDVVGGYGIRPLHALSVAAAPYVPYADDEPLPSKTGGRSQRGTPSADKTGGNIWHTSARGVGHVSPCRHVFTYAAGAKKKRVSDTGESFELSRLVTVSDSQHIRGGCHNYTFGILSGHLGR